MRGLEKKLSEERKIMGTSNREKLYSVLRGYYRKGNTMWRFKLERPFCLRTTITAEVSNL